MSRCSQILAVSFLVGIVSVSAYGGERSSATAQHYLAAGTSAFQRGEFEIAVEALSAALPDLDEEQLAKAFHLRARALRALGKPARSISDFDNALALGEGLSTAERIAAKRERTFAYAEAGLTEAETAVPGDAPIVLMAPSASSIVTGALPPSRAPLEGWSAEAASEPVLTLPSAEVAMPFATEVTTIPRAPEPSARPPTRQVAVAAPHAIAPPAWSAPEVSAVPPPAPAPVVWEGETQVSEAPPAPAPAAPAQAALSGTEATVAGGDAGSAPGVAGQANGRGTPQVAAVAPPVPAPAAPSLAAPPQTEPRDAATSAPTGGSASTMLNIGTVRSQSEAYALTVRAVSLIGHRVNGGRLSIIPIDAGNAYKVRLGPYADYEIAHGICEQLRMTSFNCNVEGGSGPPSAATMPVDVAELPPLSSPGPGASR